MKCRFSSQHRPTVQEVLSSVGQHASVQPLHTWTVIWLGQSWNVDDTSVGRSGVLWRMRSANWRIRQRNELYWIWRRPSAEVYNWKNLCKYSIKIVRVDTRHIEMTWCPDLKPLFHFVMFHLWCVTFVHVCVCFVQSTHSGRYATGSRRRHSLQVQFIAFWKVMDSFSKISRTWKVLEIKV